MVLPSVRGAAALPATLGVALALGAAPAPAQQPSPAPGTVTASGVGRAEPEPADRRSETSIRAAVARAKADAVPLAVADARRRAALLAGAAGLKLGAPVAVADVTASAPYFYLPQDGTFGPNRYCRMQRRVRTVRTGTRVRRVAFGPARKVCRVPEEVSVTVSVTFSAGQQPGASGATAG